MLEEQEITEFELEQDGVKLRICRSTGGGDAGGAVISTPPTVAAPVTLPVAAPAPAAATAPAAQSPPASEAVPETPEAPAGTLVESPIVGTFYRAPDPNSKPFVSVGDRVQIGQVLCIIEAMKLMNEIEAEVAGEVVQIHQDNGQPVQYGDRLFTIRPA